MVLKDSSLCEAGINGSMNEMRAAVGNRQKWLRYLFCENEKVEIAEDSILIIGTDNAEAHEQEHFPPRGTPENLHGKYRDNAATSAILRNRLLGT